MKISSYIRPAALAVALAAGYSVIETAATAQCCGARASINQPRIVGGTVAPRGAYPWMTALVERGQTPQNGQFCGGALIHPQWVLTASHCVEGTTAASLDVIVGAYNLTEANGSGRRVQVTQIIMHPNYGDVNGATVNDVALLKLATPITDVPIIPMVDNAARIATGTALKGMGFGTTTEGGNPSTVLRHVDLQVISLASAGNVYTGLNSGHLAAGVAAGGRDTCQGDSGGPLVVSDGAGGWMQAGVVSYGDGCARPGVPGIYANVLTFRPWILEKIGGQPPVATDDHGNTLATATAATLATATAGNLEKAGDIDVLKVTLTGAGTLTATSTGNTALTASLQGAGGSVLAQGTGSPNVSFSSKIDAAGTCYLVLSGATAQTTGAYSTTMRFTAAPVVGGPEIALLGKNNAAINDNNNAPDSTKGTLFGPLSIGQKTSTAFQINNSGTAALTLGNVVLSGSDATQFRVSVQPAAQVSAGRSTSFAIEYAPTEGGNHNAEVTITTNDADENPYNFSLSGNALDVAGDDHGDSAGEATLVSAPGMIAGVISDSGSDVDVFKFTLTKKTKLTVKTTGNLDTYGTLLNASGRTIAEADDSAGDLNFSMRRTFAPGTYYIIVEGYDAAESGPYTLQINR